MYTILTVFSFLQILSLVENTKRLCCLHVSISAKGLYRELSAAEYCAELQSEALPLLIGSPNAVNDVGINREKWVTRTWRSLHADMLRFLGQLMGVVIRSQQPLDLDLPSIVLKQHVRSPITK